jgi:hypothetical protein
MSNAMAIAAVTRVVQDALRFNISSSDIAGLDPEVWSLPPDLVESRIEEQGNVINFFMYRTTYNQGWRNHDLPARSNPGDVLTRPKLGLDLYYMLSCYGADELYGDMMLGYAMQVLHNNPVLSRSFITDQLAAMSGSIFSGVRNSNLADQIEMVKIVPDDVNTEELSRLWTSYGAKYRQSAFYRATVVLIESEEPVRVVLPVEKSMLYVRPFSEPEITELQAKASLTAPPHDILLIQPGQLLRIRGNSLLGDTTEVRINGTVAAIQGSPANEEIIVSLPASLVPGIQSVQIIHLMKLGDPPVDHKGTNSNVKAFVLNPHITGITLNPGDITLSVSSPVEAEQKVRLLLNERVPPAATHAPHNYTFEFAHPGPVAAGPITVPVAGVVAGEYIVRLQVDKYFSVVPENDLASYLVTFP